MKVVVQNYGTSKGFEVQQLSADEIRIIARDEAKGVVRSDTPTVVAGDMKNPNGKISKSLERHTHVVRRRGN
jgi:hypothetical protein